jgi:hypothetical protein
VGAAFLALCGGLVQPAEASGPSVTVNPAVTDPSPTPDLTFTPHPTVTLTAHSGEAYSQTSALVSTDSSATNSWTGDDVDGLSFDTTTHTLSGTISSTGADAGQLKQPGVQPPDQPTDLFRGWTISLPRVGDCRLRPAGSLDVAIVGHSASGSTPWCGPRAACRPDVAGHS